MYHQDESNDQEERQESSLRTILSQLHPWRVLRENRLLILFGLLTTLFGVLLTWLAIAPRYTDPITRLYTSKLGYAGVARKLGKPFSVTAVTVKVQPISAVYQGEGTTQSEPVMVPLIPMGTLLSVRGEVGDHVKKGDLLVVIDDRKARVKIAAAKAAIDIAISELERTEIGSSYILEQERPERDKIRLKYATLRAQIHEELIAMEAELNHRGVANRLDLLKQRLEQIEVLARIDETELSLQMAEVGSDASVEIAKAKIREAELALDHRELELEEYRIYSPADGIIERRLVHEGEYNQDPGRPAFLLATGLWFEARMDQTTLGRFAVGDPAEIYLEAYPGQPISGTISKILPLVSYDLGGPESTRPIRPLGTGAPEWPSTFGVQVSWESGPQIVPGLTGFARIYKETNGISIPNVALVARSGRTAFVYRVEGDQWKAKDVVLGLSARGYTEILEGLKPGDIILSNGYQVLESGDQVAVEVLDQKELKEPLILRDGNKNLEEL